ASPGASETACRRCRSSPRPEAEREVAARALVVGAGVAGAATALELARAGFAVTLLEAERPAFGASGRNPGFLFLVGKQSGLPLEFAQAGRDHQAALAE